MSQCLHPRRSGQLSLLTPARTEVLAQLVCDDCGRPLSEVEAAGVEATRLLAHDD